MQLRDVAGLALNSTDNANNINQTSNSKDPAAIDKVARNLESAFAKLLISSMRSSGLSDDDSLFPGAAGHYRDLYDQQIARIMSEGRGLGLQAAIRHQLGGETALPASSAHSSAPSSAMYPLTDTTQPLPVRLLPLALSTSGPPPQTAAQEYAIDLPAAAYERPSVCSATAARFAETRGATTPEEFVAAIWPHAQQAATELGIPAKTLVAQAALETGWGRKIPRQPGGSEAHNLFGIKATGRWRGESVTTTTTEFVNNVAHRETANFRAYASPADSFADYVRLLKNNPRYADTLNSSGDGKRFAQALQQAGYATDPNYAAKLDAIAEGPTLRRALQRLASTAEPPPLRA